MDVEQGTFTPLVFTTTGGMEEECKRYHNRLAELVAAKKGENYATTVSWIRSKVSFAILRSALLCLRGSRTAKRTIKSNGQEAAFELDDALPKSRSYNFYTYILIKYSSMVENNFLLSSVLSILVSRKDMQIFVKKKERYFTSHFLLFFLADCHIWSQYLTSYYLLFFRDVTCSGYKVEKSYYCYFYDVGRLLNFSRKYHYHSMRFFSSFPLADSPPRDLQITAYE